MINLQTLGGLLRILQPAEVTPKTAQPLEPLVPVQAVKPVATESAQAWRATDAHSQGGAGNVPYPGARAEGQPGAASSLQLSRAGAVLDQLLRLPGGEPVRAARPLSTGPLDAAALARALQESIVRSGLFYESHLAAALLHRRQAPGAKEPQSAWIAAGASATPADTATSGIASTPTTVLPEPAAALVRQQVDVLETGRILWQGEPWPGQAALVEIREDERGGAPTEPGAATAWRTRVALDLPGLGRVEALLALAGSRLQLDLRAADSGSRELLKESLPSLVKALTARSLELASIVVHHEPTR